MSAKKCPTCHNVHGSFVPKRPKPAKRKAKKRSVTKWVIPYRYIGHRRHYVRMRYTKKEIVADRLFFARDPEHYVYIGPITRVEVPL